MILPIVLQAICPTIRCCSQHLMVGVNFFLTSSPILDLGHFLQVILPIVLQIMPQPKNNPNHQVLWTASDGWVFFFYLFSHSRLRVFFCKWFCQLYYKLCLPPKITPTIRCCEQHFSQVILPIVLQIRPQPKNNPNHQVLWTASDGWVFFFFDLFSHSGLRAFFASDFANCTTNYASRQKVILPIVLQIVPQPKNNPNHQVLWTAPDGWVFFYLFSDSGLRAFFTNNFANCTTDYMLNHQVLFTASDCWG